jgi:hypothetical protein
MSFAGLSRPYGAHWRRSLRESAEEDLLVADAEDESARPLVGIQPIVNHSPAWFVLWKVEVHGELNTSVRLGDKSVIARSNVGYECEPVVLILDIEVLVNDDLTIDCVRSATVASSKL